jgi:pseudouridine kinase
VLVIGGANLDIKCRADHAYRRGTSNPGSMVTSTGGVANNVARNLAQMNARSTFVGAVGRDEAGRRVLRELRSAGVDVSKCVRTHHPTGAYVALLDGRGALVGAVSDMAGMGALTPKMLGTLIATIAGSDLLFADCNLSESSLLFLARAAQRAGIAFAVDTVSIAKSIRLLPLLKARVPIFALSFNRDEARALCKALRWPHQRWRDMLERLHKLGVAHVMLHMGPKGALVCAKSADRAKPSVRTVAARTSKPLDVTGAGDAAIAATLRGLLGGLDIVSAATLGQHAAALTLSGMASVRQPRRRR